MLSFGTASRRLAYGAADLLTLRRGIPRRVNQRTIRFPPALARYFPSSYQPETDAFLSAHCRPGTTAIDVGAHVGLFTCVMARAVTPGGRVLAFEPVERNCAALADLVARNGLAHLVEVRTEVVGRDSGEVTFFAASGTANNAGSVVRRSGTTATVLPSVAIDDVVAPDEPISCIKVDAEGAEYEVLVGARRTLERQRPAVALDVHPRQLAELGLTAADLLERMTEVGYSLDERSAAKLASLGPDDGPTDVFFDG